MFLIRVIKDSKPVNNATVKLSETGLFGSMIRCSHTGDGWYQGDSNAKNGEVFVNGDSYGNQKSTATIIM